MCKKKDQRFHLGKIRKNFIPSVTTMLINPVLVMWRSLNVYALCLCLIYLYCAVCSLVSTYSILLSFAHSLWCLCSVSDTCVYVLVLHALLFNAFLCSVLPCIFWSVWWSFKTRNETVVIDAQYGRGHPIYYGKLVLICQLINVRRANLTFCTSHEDGTTTQQTV